MTSRSDCEPLPKPTLSPFALARPGTFLRVGFFFTAAVWCVPALRVPLVHSLINHFRQKQRGRPRYVPCLPSRSVFDGWTMPASTEAPTLTSVPDGSESEPPSAEALAEQQRLATRKQMQQETETQSLEPPPPPPPGTSNSRAGARELEERRVITAAIQRGANERRVGGGAAATSRLPPAGRSVGTSLQPLRALKRSPAGGGGATAREPRRAGGLLRAGSAPRARPSGGGGGASHETDSDAAALKVRG